MIEKNKWDEIPLDEFILPLFNEKQKWKLEEVGFLGKYVLDGEGVCYRTQIALRILCIPVNQWQRLVDNGLEDGDKHQEAVDAILLEVLKSFFQSADEKLESIQVLVCGLASQRDTLSRRWNQIHLLLSTAMKGIER